MQTMSADWAARTANSAVDSQLAACEDEISGSERISPRALEILQVLNDVFNTLPTPTQGGENWSGGQR
jgi:hypothetical protein